MNRILVYMLAFGILAGCTSNGSTEMEEVAGAVQEDKQVEDSYIKAVIDSSKTITQNVGTLNALWNDMNVNDEAWKSDVEEISLEITGAINEYLISELELTDGLEDKYKNTKGYFSEAVLKLGALSADMGNALETSDIKGLQKIKNRIDQSSSLVSKASEELEIERNKED